ncbi:MAG: outer membrane beta-barrel protein [Rickettsiella sp.]|nr:outer membrane beta-barrel protein [Rickettsiella sp.]
MNYLKSILGLIFLLVVQTVSANCLSNDKCYTPLTHFYIDVGAGWVFDQQASDYYLPRDPLPDRYVANTSKNNVMGLASLGYVWRQTQDWLPFISVGLEYSYLPSSKIQGPVEEFSSPEFTTQNYEYKVQHQNLQLTSKIDIYRCGRWMPYIALGIGTSWNTSSAYQEYALTDQPEIQPEFANKTKTAFSYAAGLGIDFIANDNLWLGLGYRYDNFGSNQTNNGIREFANKHLDNHMKAHTVLLSLRYLFL